MQTAARPQSSFISRLDSDRDFPECLKANAEMFVDAVCGYKSCNLSCYSAGYVRRPNEAAV